ncbi:MAG: hypothetical protein LC808_21110 [Actinobacteria bacterium]|nr:hypothetical protein [Actinomycetota bacterium]
MATAGDDGGIGVLGDRREADDVADDHPVWRDSWYIDSGVHHLEHMVV